MMHGSHLRINKIFFEKMLGDIYYIIGGIIILYFPDICQTTGQNGQLLNIRS